MLIGYEGAFTATQSAPETNQETLRRREFPADCWWFSHRWSVVQLGWTRSPTPADVIPPEEPAGRRVYPNDQQWFTPRRTHDHIGVTKGPVRTRWEVLQKRATTADGVGSVSLSFLNSCSSGNFVVVDVSCQDTTGTRTATCTVGGVSTGPEAVTVRNASLAGGFRAWRFTLKLAASGAHEVVVTFDGSASFIRLSIAELRGNAAANVLDKVNSATGTGTAPSSGSVSPDTDYEFIHGYALTGTGDISVGAGFNPLQNADNFDEPEYREQGLKESVSATWTSADGQWLALVATYRSELVGEETIARREVFIRALFTRPRGDDLWTWLQSPRDSAVAAPEESIHRREFPPELRRALDFGYAGFQRGPLSTNFIEPQDPIQSREYPRDKWWFLPRRDRELETWQRSPTAADNTVSFGSREFVRDVWIWVPRRRRDLEEWLRSPLPGNVEPQSGQTIRVEPLQGCGSNPWRMLRLRSDAQFTWTRWQTEVPLVVETPPIRGEWPADLRFWKLPDYRRDLYDFTASPQVSHWCEVGATFLYTAANWSVGVQFYFEAYFRAFTGTGRVRLFNKTDNTFVAGSEVSTASPVMVRMRSGPLTLVDGREYITQIAAEVNVNATAIESSRLVVI